MKTASIFITYFIFVFIVFYVCALNDSIRRDEANYQAVNKALLSLNEANRNWLNIIPDNDSGSSILRSISTIRGPYAHNTVIIHSKQGDVPFFHNFTKLNIESIIHSMDSCETKICIAERQIQGEILLITVKREKNQDVYLVNNLASFFKDSSIPYQVGSEVSFFSSNGDKIFSNKIKIQRPFFSQKTYSVGNFIQLKTSSPILLLGGYPLSVGFIIFLILGPLLLVVFMSESIARKNIVLEKKGIEQQKTIKDLKTEFHSILKKIIKRLKDNKDDYLLLNIKDFFERFIDEGYVFSSDENKFHIGPIILDVVSELSLDNVKYSDNSSCDIFYELVSVGESQKVKKILEIIVSNAFDHASSCEDGGWVDVSISEEKDYVVTIRNKTKYPMDSTTIDKINNMLKGIDGGSSKTTGHGVGLLSVYHMLKTTDGVSVAFCSEKSEKEAVFKVSLRPCLRKGISDFIVSKDNEVVLVSNCVEFQDETRKKFKELDIAIIQRTSDDYKTINNKDVVILLDKNIKDFERSKFKNIFLLGDDADDINKTVFLKKMKIKTTDNVEAVLIDDEEFKLAGTHKQDDVAWFKTFSDFICFSGVFKKDISIYIDHYLKNEEMSLDDRLKKIKELKFNMKNVEIRSSSVSSEIFDAKNKFNVRVNHEWDII